MEIKHDKLHANVSASMYVFYILAFFSRVNKIKLNKSIILRAKQC